MVAVCTAFHKLIEIVNYYLYLGKIKEKEIQRQVKLGWTT